MDFKDPDMSTLMWLMDTCIAYTEFEDELDTYYTVIRHINDICDTTTTIRGLVSLLSTDMFTKLISLLEDFRCYIEFEDEGDECVRIENMLRREFDAKRGML